MQPPSPAARPPLFAVFEELQPPLFFGFDRAGGEFAQFEQADAAMLQQGAATFVAQAVAVGVGGIVAQEVVAQQPGGIGRAQFPIILAAMQLLAVQVAGAWTKGSGGGKRRLVIFGKVVTALSRLS